MSFWYFEGWKVYFDYILRYNEQVFLWKRCCWFSLEFTFGESFSIEPFLFFSQARYHQEILPRQGRVNDWEDVLKGFNWLASSMMILSLLIFCDMDSPFPDPIGLYNAWYVYLHLVDLYITCR